MASSEMRDKVPAQTAEVTAAVEGEAKPSAPAPKDERAGRRMPGSRAIGAADRDRLLKDARNVDFPAGVRGYQRSAVDRYVERVNRLITELEMYSSPEAAVRHALDEVGEETREILQRAHQSAEEITVRSRARADERLEQGEREARDALVAAEQQAREMREAAQREAQASREAAQHDAQATREAAQRHAQEVREVAERETRSLREAAERETQSLRATAQREADELLEAARSQAGEMLERAETRASELGRSAEVMWRERRRLIDDVRAVGEQLVTLGDAEAKRFARPPEDMPLGELAEAPPQPAHT